MSLQVEKLEKNMAKLTVEASADEFEAAIQKVYQKNKNKITVQGFRKGKAPRVIIEKMYGAGIFYEDAANELIPKAYEKALDECDFDIVSRPEIDLVQVEKGKPFIFTAEVAVKPEVTLGQYKEIEVEKQEIEVTEEEVMEKVNNELDQNSRTLTIDDRAVQDGDIVVIDYEGFVDGTGFEGGKAENYSLTIGSHSFIGNFEEQLIGKVIGEETEVNVVFPEEYHVKELAGSPVLFKVTIKEIKMKELPELNDDFAQDVSEFDTLEDYKESIKKGIMESKEKEAKTARQNEIIDKIIENAVMEIPDPMIDGQVNQMADEFSKRLQSQGLSVEQYFKFTGMNTKDYLKHLRPQALKQIQSKLVLEAVAQAENITPSEEEFEKELDDIAAMYNMDKEKLRDMFGEKEEKQIQKDIAVEKAVEFVTEQAKEVESKQD
jgi:trigger factor